MTHPGLFVLHEVDDHHGAPLEDPARHLPDRVGGLREVLEHHVGEGRVDLTIRERERVGVAASQLDLRQSGLVEFGLGGGEHPARPIDADHAQAEPSELDREDARPGPDVRDGLVGFDESSDRARAHGVVVEHFAQRVPLWADRVEEAPRTLGARLDHAQQGCVVALDRGVVGDVSLDERPGISPWALGWSRKAVEDVGAIAPVAQEARLAQDREVP